MTHRMFHTGTLIPRPGAPIEFRSERSQLLEKLPGDSRVTPECSGNLPAPVGNNGGELGGWHQDEPRLGGRLGRRSERPFASGLSRARRVSFLPLTASESSRRRGVQSIAPFALRARAAAAVDAIARARARVRAFRAVVPSRLVVFRSSHSFGRTLSLPLPLSLCVPPSTFPTFAAACSSSSFSCVPFEASALESRRGKRDEVGNGAVSQSSEAVKRREEE